MSLFLFFADLIGGLLFFLFASDRTRSARGSLEEMVRRHSRAVVLRSELVTWPGILEDEAETVRFVIGGQAGLSFKDAHGFEVVKVASTGLHLEMIDDQTAPYLRATNGDGEPVDFWIDGTSQQEALAALTAAVHPTPRLGT